MQNDFSRIGLHENKNCRTHNADFNTDGNTDDAKLQLQSPYTFLKHFNCQIIQSEF